MNRRELFRSTLITSIGAAALPQATKAREFPPGYDASKELTGPDWKPVLLDEHQNETLIALSEAIIPATDTPGAKAALVNRFLDMLMASEPAETQHAFFEALSFIDGLAMEQYKSAFVYLTPAQQNELLSILAYPHRLPTWGDTEGAYIGNEHFGKLKTWIASAFYSSPVGLKELGWDGSFPHGSYTGCDHDEAAHPASSH